MKTRCLHLLYAPRSSAIETEKTGEEKLYHLTCSSVYDVYVTDENSSKSYYRKKTTPVDSSVFSVSPLLFVLRLWSVSVLLPPVSELKLVVFVCDRLLLRAIGLFWSIELPTPSSPMAWTPSPYAFSIIHFLSQSGSISPGCRALPGRTVCVCMGVEDGPRRSWRRNVHSI